MKRYDVVVYGATGFTGMYVLGSMVGSPEYDGVSIAVAGRNRKKIEKSLDTISNKTGKDIRSLPIIIANCDDPQSVADMAKQAKVVMNAVGPYRLYGEAIVRACIENGASHLDIAGEENFVEDMADKFGQLAKEKGVYVIGACGWDSIPCDMGVNFLKKNFDGDLNHVETFVEVNRSRHGYAFNDGTYQTLILFLLEGKSEEFMNIRKRIMPVKLNKGTVKPPKRRVLFKVRERLPGGWAVPFIGADHSVVERSEYYASQEKGERPLHVKTYFSTNFIEGLLLVVWMGMFSLCVKCSLSRKFLQKYPCISSFGLFKAKGPTEAQIANTTFTYYFVGSGYKQKLPVDEQHFGKPDRKMTAVCKGPDPGYMSAGGCAAAATLAMVKDADKLPKQGGVYTTASAFRDTNIYDYLKLFNVHYHVESTEDL